jgi:hypothetical protein
MPRLRLILLRSALLLHGMKMAKCSVGCLFNAFRRTFHVENFRLQ